jgi:hypothetical protein
MDDLSVTYCAGISLTNVTVWSGQIHPPYFSITPSLHTVKGTVRPDKICMRVVLMDRPCTATKIPFIYSFSGHIPNFTSMCRVSDLYNSQDWSTYFPAAELADRSWKYINRSWTHECGNWDCGRPIPFLEIFV